MFYPVLTYGTLRPSCSNYAFLDGRSVPMGDVILDGYKMFAGINYPYVIEGDGEIVATLNYITPAHYEETMHDLDFLEGFKGTGSRSNHYERILVDVPFNGEMIKAWMYVAMDERVVARVVNDLYFLPGGDWMEFLELLKTLTPVE